MQKVGLNFDNGLISLGDEELGFRVEGHGDRKLLLIHGLNSHSGTWRNNISSLSTDATVVAPSLPTTQDGATPERAEVYAGQVAALCASLGIEKFGVVGNSMGGWVAMRLVAQHRRLVTRLILEDTAGRNSEDVGAVERSRVPVLIVWGERDRLLPVETGRELHSRLSGSEIRVIRGAGHVPHWERPEEFNRVVGEFLARP